MIKNICIEKKAENQLKFQNFFPWTYYFDSSLKKPVDFVSSFVEVTII